jgi:hypothetical protein
LTRAGNAAALHLFEQAIGLDPSFAVAYAPASECYRLKQNIGWIHDDPSQLAVERRLALKAVELGQDDAVALACAAQFFGFAARETDTADALVDQALSVACA